MVAPRASPLPPRGTSCGFRRSIVSSDDRGGISAGTFPDSGKLLGELDEGLEGGLSVEIVLSTGGLISFEVEPQRSAHSAGSAEPEDDTAAVDEADTNALPPADRAIHRIVIGEVIGIGDLQAAKALTDQPRQLGAQVVDQRIRLARIHFFIVVPRIIVAAIDRPVVLDDGVDALLAHGKDVEPEQHGPEPVLLAHMVRTGAGALLAADRHTPGVQQIAEELPPRRRLVHFDAVLL